MENEECCDDCEDGIIYDNTCGLCNGSGEGMYDGSTCRRCKGKGSGTEYCDCPRGQERLKEEIF